MRVIIKWWISIVNYVLPIIYINKQTYSVDSLWCGQILKLVGGVAVALYHLPSAINTSYIQVCLHIFTSMFAQITSAIYAYVCMCLTCLAFFVIFANSSATRLCKIIYASIYQKLRGVV